MKRLMSLTLLIACLCPLLSSAFALTVPEMVQAPAHVTERYTSATGKTVIEVDASVFVPDSQRVSVYGIQPRKYNLAEIQAMAEAAFGQEPYEGDVDFKVQHQQIGPTSTFEHWLYSLSLSTRKLIQTGRTDRPLPAAQLGVLMQELPGGFIIHAGAEYEMQQVIGEGTYFANQAAMPLRRQPKGTSMTFNAAKKIADHAVAAFAPGRTLAGVAILQDEVMEKGSVDIAKSSREGYALYYTLNLDLPLTYVHGEIGKADFLETTQSELITVVVDDRGIRNLMYNWPHQLTGVLQEDATLLSFSQAMDIAGRLLPLKYASWERYYQKVQIMVSDIRLGYMRVPQRENPRQFQLVPVWDFFGNAVFANSQGGGRTVTWDWAYNSLLTLNALDGTVIDREYGN